MDPTVIDSIEFVINDIDSWGMREVHGIARLEPDALIVEFRTHLLGLVRTGLREVRIPLAELVEVTFDYRLVYSLIRIRTRSLKTIDGIPGLSGASVKLQVRGWQSRRPARAFVAEVNYQRAILPDPVKPQPRSPSISPEDPSARLPDW